MKGLRLTIPPFAPDQSGAVSVLFDLEGIVVICDAGGCSGNICAFDEPRWGNQKSAIFSAGLRDMDAILGRDDKLVKKLKDTSDKLDCKFAAIIGTPVPAVIATDYNALCKMSEKKTNLPVIGIDTTGTYLYDEGESKAYTALFNRFIEKDVEKVNGKVGVIGVTPLDYFDEQILKIFDKNLKEEGYKEVVCYGYNEGLLDYKNALSVEKNIVVSVAGIKPAKYLQQNFGIPYEIACPIDDEMIEARVLEKDLAKNPEIIKDKKVLVVNQQVMANRIREVIEKYNPEKVDVATWFMMEKEIKREDDFTLTEEDQWKEIAMGYDVIIADDNFRKAVKNFDGEWIFVPHYAVSGQLGGRVIKCNFKYESMELCKA